MQGYHAMHPPIFSPTVQWVDFEDVGTRERTGAAGTRDIGTVEPDDLVR